jgi:hypothetical protein
MRKNSIIKLKLSQKQIFSYSSHFMQRKSNQSWKVLIEMLISAVLYSSFNLLANLLTINWILVEDGKHERKSHSLGF